MYQAKVLLLKIKEGRETMSTVHTCTTQEEGWALYNHFIGNLLLVIKLHLLEEGEKEDQTDKDKRERIIYDAWAQLAGNLYMIMRRMNAHGHIEVANKMQAIIDLVVELDLTDPKVHRIICEKQSELDPNTKNFEAELAKLRAQHGHGEP